MANNQIKDRLFHDQGYIYFSPLEPKLGESVTVRLQSKEELLKAEIEVKIRNTDEEISVYPMTYEGKDKVESFDLWVGNLPAETRKFHYRFKAYFKDGSISYYNIYGETTEEEFKGGFYVIPGFSTPDWTKGAFWYSLIPPCFYNGDVLNDKTGHVRDVPAGSFDDHFYMCKHGGDLKGIEQKIDYFKDLNVDAIFINPIWKSGAESGYGPDNFEMIDTAYGTDKDLCDLVEKLHSNDMKIMLDAVIVFATTHNNFVNEEKEWPIPAAFSAPDNKYCDYFFFKQWPHSYQNYFASLDFDYSKDLVKDYMFRNTDSHIQRYLAEPYNIDAWRFDSSDLLWGQNMTAHDVSKEIKPFVKKYGDDKLFLSENFTNPDEGVWETCWNMHNLFNLREWMMQKYDLSGFLWKMRWSMNERTRPFALSMYTHFDNHDVGRLYNVVNEKSRLFAGILCYMTYLGSPVLYYGDEAADKTIPWGSYYGFNWNTDDWDGDFYRIYKTLSALRKAKKVFKKGIVRIGYMDVENEILSFGRFDENDTVITVMNPTSNIADVTLNVDIYELKDGETVKDIISGAIYKVQNGKIAVKAEPGGAVLVKNADGLDTFKDLCEDKVMPSVNLQNRVPKKDWAYSFTVKSPESDGFVGVFAGSDKDNSVFAGLNRKDGRNILGFGRIVNGKKVAFFEKEIEKNSAKIILQRVGTRYSVVYSLSDDKWNLLGDNLFANYTITVLEHLYENATESLLADGKFINNFRCAYGLDGDLDKYFSAGDLLRTEFVGNMEDFEYINRGIRQKNIDGFHALMCAKSLKDYRMNVVLKANSGEGEYGVLIASDKNGKNGYRFAIAPNAEWKLYKQDTVLDKGTVELDSKREVNLVVEALNETLVIYNGNPLTPICQLKIADICGNLGFYTDGIAADILNYHFCDLSKNVTKQWAFWNVTGDKASMEGTGQMGLKGCAYTNYETEVKVSFKPCAEGAVAEMGILVAASDGMTPATDGLFFSVTSNGEFLLKHKNEILYKFDIDNNLESHTIKIKANNGNYEFSVDGSEVNTYKSDDFISGTISVAVMNAKAEFSDLKIRSYDI